MVSLLNYRTAKVEYNQDAIKFSKEKVSEMKSRQCLSSLWYNEQHPKDHHGIFYYHENWLIFPDTEDNFPTLRTLSIRTIQNNFHTLKINLRELPFSLQWEVHHQSV
jgi:hypothetical protein